VLAVAASLAAGPAWSAIIYSNGTPNLSGASAVVTSQVFAESFTLSIAATIRGVEFDTEEFPSSWDGTLDYFFFSNNSPQPSSSVLLNGQGHDPLLSRTFIVNGETTSFSELRYDFNLITPLTLNAGEYWLGLHLQKDFASNFGVSWLGTNTPNAQISANAPGGNFNSWGLDALQLVLGISDTPLVAPEPASFILLGSALLAIGCWGKRRPV
jgi:hypothetical protein